jgi:hypothetical protein
MTEYSPYRPDAAPQGVQQERLVFVDPADRHGREFHIDTQAARPVIGGDSPEVNAAVEAAYREAEASRNEAASRTAEYGSTDAELAQAIDWNAQAVQATRDYIEVNGF